MKENSEKLWVKMAILQEGLRYTLSFLKNTFEESSISKPIISVAL